MHVCIILGFCIYNYSTESNLVYKGTKSEENLRWEKLLFNIYNRFIVF